MDASEPTAAIESGPATYDGFISYSHSADDLLAPRLQAGLQKFAKPWWKRRAVRIFRDESSLAANPHLWSSITEALDDSGWFVLLLSPDAASSEWVGKEIEHWVANKPADRILPAVTDGDFGWENGDVVGSSVPPTLHGVFQEEPRWVDLRFAKGDENLDLKNPAFSLAVADIAATIRGIPKDELASEEVRQHRRTIRTAWAAGGLVTILALAAGAAGLFAIEQRNDARDSAALAEANANEADANAALAKSRELAASAINVVDSDPELAILLTLEAIEQTPTGVDQPAEVIDALWTAVQEDRLVQVIETNVRDQDTRVGGQQDPVSVALSPDGSTLFVTDITGLSIEAYSTSGLEKLWTHQGEVIPDQFFFFYLNTRMNPAGDRVLFDWFGPSVSGFTILNANDGSEVFTHTGYDRCSVGAIGWTADGTEFLVTGGDVSAPDPEFASECHRDGLDNAAAWLETLDGATFDTLDLIETPFDVAGSLDDAGRLFQFSNDDEVRILEPPDYASHRVLEGVRGWGTVSADGSVVVTFDAPADPCFLDLIVVTQTVCGTLATYDTTTGRRLDLLEPLPSFPIDLSFAGSDRLLAVPTEGATTLIWDLATGKPIHALPSGNAVNATVSTDGTRAYTGHGGGLVKVWDLTPNVGLEPVGELGAYSLVSANTNTIAQTIGAFVAINEGTLESRVLFFDIATGELVGQPITGQQPILPVADDRFLIPEFHAGMPYSWLVYDPMTSERTRIAGCELDFATGMCTDGTPPVWYFWGLSDDGTELLRFGDGARTIIDPDDGAVIGELIPAHDFAFIGAYSDEVVTGSFDASFFVEDRATGEEIARLETAGVFDLSADGGTLVFYKVDRMAIVDTSTWEIWEFPIDLGLVRGMAANTELRRLAVGDENGLHVLDFDTGELLTSIPIPGVSDMHWLSEDRLLVSTQTGAWAAVSLLADELIGSARAGVTRGFTAAECKTYRIDPCPTLGEIRGR